MTDQFENQEVTSDDKLWALLAYLFTPLVPVVILLLEDKKNRPYLKAHNIQALVFGMYIDCWILNRGGDFCIGSCLIPVRILALIGIHISGKIVTIP
jgi:uncharacterized membrane protein